MSMIETETLISLLSLPDHLRKTLIIMQIHRHGTADEVAQETKRARAVESSYLNILTTMGLLKKERQGRKAYFHIENVHEETASLYKKLKNMPKQFRTILCDDMLTALQNRIEVLSRVNHN